MNKLNDLYGAFSVQFKQDGKVWLLHIIPEMAPAREGLKALGSYFIYCVHPDRGSNTFIIQQDDKFLWFSEALPPFIEPMMVQWIGKTIEESVSGFDEEDD